MEQEKDVMEYDRTAFSLNRRKVHLGDGVWVVTVGLQERKGRIVEDPDWHILAQGVLDSLIYSRGLDDSLICVGKAMCRVPVRKKKGTGWCLRPVEFPERDGSPDENAMQVRLKQVIHARKEALAVTEERREAARRAPGR